MQPLRSSAAYWLSSIYLLCAEAAFSPTPMTGQRRTRQDASRCLLFIAAAADREDARCSGGIVASHLDIVQNIVDIGASVG